MDDLRLTIIVFTAIAGAAVLGSYVWGIMRADDPQDLWGGVGPGMQKAIVPVMLAAAAGFLAFFILLMFKADVQTLLDLRWPWAESDGNGDKRMLAAMVLFLIPSIFWLEATALHLRSPAAWTPILTIGILFVVGVGVAMMMLMAFSAWKDGVANAGWMFAGITALGVQCIINDLLIWSIKFPWRAA